MDWANESYVRLYTRETADDLELSWEALALWRALLPRFDQSGLFAVRNGWTSVSKATRIPLHVVEAAAAELVSDGRVRLIKEGVFAPNFVEAQTASKSDRARQRESRDRRRARAESAPSVPSNHVSSATHTAESGQVIEIAHSNHGVSHAVTSQSHAVTPSHSLLCSADPLPCSALPLGAQDKPALQTDLSRFQDKVDVNAAKAKRARGTQLPADWAPRAEERAWASQHTLDCDAEAEHFRDHHTARGTSFRDWHAGFRTWLRNAANWKRQKQPAKQQQLGGVSAALLRMANGES